MSDLSLGLTLDQAATAIGVSRSTLERRIRAGVIAKRKDGGIVRVAESEIRRYVAAQTLSTSASAAPPSAYGRGREIAAGDRLWD